MPEGLTHTVLKRGTIDAEATQRHQQILINSGFLKPIADDEFGTFGRKTERATRDLQGALGIKKDGIVGAVTHYAADKMAEHAFNENGADNSAFMKKLASAAQKFEQVYSKGKDIAAATKEANGIFNAPGIATVERPKELTQSEQNLKKINEPVLNVDLTGPTKIAAANAKRTLDPKLQKMMDDGLIKTMDSSVILGNFDQKCQAKLVEFMDAYHKHSGPKDDIVFNSGVRGARQQALAMYDNYKSGDAPSYKQKGLAAEIRKAYDDTKKDGSAATVAAMERVILKQMEKGDYISNHMTGKCVDIDPNSIDREAYKKALKDCKLTESYHAGHYHLDLSHVAKDKTQLAKADSTKGRGGK